MLQERAAAGKLDEGDADALREILTSTPGRVHQQLRALWALDATGGLTRRLDPRLIRATTNAPRVGHSVLLDWQPTRDRTRMPSEEPDRGRERASERPARAIAACGFGHPDAAAPRNA